MSSLNQSPDPVLRASYAACVRVAATHYENFPVASRLVPAEMRPHIAAVYGLEESNGVRAIAMELVEGPTLAERNARKRIPIKEASLLPDRSSKRWNMRTKKASSIGT